MKRRYFLKGAIGLAGVGLAAAHGAVLPAAFEAEAPPLRTCILGVGGLGVRVNSTAWSPVSAIRRRGRGRWRVDA